MGRPMTACERAVLAALGDPEQPATAANIARRIGVKTTNMKSAVQALRWRGIVHWDRLVLATAAGDDSRRPQNPEDFGEVPGISPIEQRLHACPTPDAVSDIAAPGRNPAHRSTATVVDQTPRRIPGKSPEVPRISEPACRSRQIGDIEPLPAEWSREAWQRQRRTQTSAAGASNKGGVAMRIIAREQDKIAAEAVRALDPIEQAKTIIRRRGTPVYAADVLDPKKKGFIVGRRVLSADELLHEAGMGTQTRPGRSKRKEGEAAAP